jgi:hypothetical protein
VRARSLWLPQLTTPACLLLTSLPHSGLDLLKVGYVYRFSNARISLCRDSAYSKETTSDYDMIITQDSQIHELGPEVANFAKHSLRPIELSELPQVLQKQKEAQEQQQQHAYGGGGANQGIFNVDVIGIVLEAGQMQSQHDQTSGA